jgi:hypothetical protein
VNNKISYHNRWRAKQFMEAFRREGATFLDVHTETDPCDIKLLKNGFHVAPKFSSLTPEELAVSYVEIVHRF